MDLCRHGLAAAVGEPDGYVPPREDRVHHRELPGVGRAIAMELAERRADVVVHFLKKRAAAMAVAEDVEKLGQRAIVTNGNLGEPEEIRRIFAEIRDAFGSLDIFVNNAALGIFRPILEIKQRHWQQTMDINVTAFLCVLRKRSN